MVINSKKLHRILIAQDDQCLVNMIYAEIEGEVFGAFSGILGLVFSAIMRLELSQPGNNIISGNGQL